MKIQKIQKITLSLFNIQIFLFVIAGLSAIFFVDAIVNGGPIPWGLLAGISVSTAMGSMACGYLIYRLEKPNALRRAASE